MSGRAERARLHKYRDSDDASMDARNEARVLGSLNLSPSTA